MAEIEWRVEVEARGTDAIKELKRKLENLEPALEAGGKKLKEGVPEAFEAGDRYWEPLADWTNAERERLGYQPVHPILVRSGGYRDSFTYFVDNDEVSLGSDDSRFETLNFGGVTDSGHAVPPRPVELSDEAIDAAVDAIWREIIKD